MCACQPAPCAASSSRGNPRSSTVRSVWSPSVTSSASMTVSSSPDPGAMVTRRRRGGSHTSTRPGPSQPLVKPAPPLSLPPCDLGVRGVHAVLPQGPVTTEPRVDLRERLGTQAVYPKLRLLTHVDEAGLTQHSQVSETPGRAIGSRAARSPTVVLTTPEDLKHGRSALVRQRLQHRIHGLCVTDWVRTRLVTDTHRPASPLWALVVWCNSPGTRGLHLQPAAERLDELFSWLGREEDPMQARLGARRAGRPGRRTTCRRSPAPARRPSPPRTWRRRCRPG